MRLNNALQRSARQLLCIALLLPVAVVAAVPDEFQRTGRAVDIHTGQPLEGQHQVTVRLYDGDGAPLAAAVYSSATNLQFTDGYFTIIGPIDATVRDLLRNGGQLFMGVQIGSDSELIPRLPIGGVLHTQLARDVTGDINPASVSANGNLAIDTNGQWVGPAAGLSGPEGPEGPIGPEGPTGPAGNKGDAGLVTGPVGPQGPQGNPGPAGAVGATGAKGQTGPQGQQGNPGVQGIKGIIGADGPIGASPQGDQGPAGQDTADCEITAFEVTGRVDCRGQDYCMTPGDATLECAGAVPRVVKSFCVEKPLVHLDRIVAPPAEVVGDSYLEIEIVPDSLYMTACGADYDYDRWAYFPGELSDRVWQCLGDHYQGQQICSKDSDGWDADAYAIDDVSVVGLWPTWYATYEITLSVSFTGEQGSGKTIIGVRTFKFDTIAPP